MTLQPRMSIGSDKDTVLIAEESMKILAHRGLWFKQEEKNTLSALFKGLDEGYGLETDVRDLDGQLVIAHDMPMLDSAIPLERLLQYYSDGGFKSTLGLNIKSDGLQEKLLHQLQDHHIDRYFVFDMSIPDTLNYLNIGMTTFLRRSDLESHPELASHVQGIWLDELTKTWIDAEVIIEQTTKTNALCIVSAELHSRQHMPQWQQIKKVLESGCATEKLLICTDFPQEAKRFFK